MKTITHNGVPCVEARVHRLATENEGRICIRHDKPHVLLLRSDIVSPVILTTHNHYNLYITTDEEIKEGDWFITDDDNQDLMHAVGAQWRALCKYDGLMEMSRKVVATTDPKLIKGASSDYSRERGLLGCDNIPQQFIQDYCNKPVDEVWIEVESIGEKGLIIVDFSKTPSENVYRSEPEHVYKLKLNSNNEVIIHNVEEKMYSEGEMISFAKYAIKNGFGLNHIENLFIKWIEESLINK